MHGLGHELCLLNENHYFPLFEHYLLLSTYDKCEINIA